MHQRTIEIDNLYEIEKISSVIVTLNVPDNMDSEEEDEYIDAWFMKHFNPSEEGWDYKDAEEYAARRIEEVGKAYERGKMMKEDSEVEIDLLGNGDEVWLCDYSESRGSAEPIKKICNVFEIGEEIIIDICERNRWCYCL